MCVRVCGICSNVDYYVLGVKMGGLEGSVEDLSSVTMGTGKYPLPI